MLVGETEYRAECEHISKPVVFDRCFGKLLVSQTREFRHLLGVLVWLEWSRHNLSNRNTLTNMLCHCNQIKVFRLQAIDILQQKSFDLMIVSFIWLYELKVNLNVIALSLVYFDDVGCFLHQRANILSRFFLFLIAVSSSFLDSFPLDLFLDHLDVFIAGTHLDVTD